MKCLFLLACLFGAILHLHSQGYIVPNGITDDGYDSGTDFGYKISIIDNPSGRLSTFSTNTQFWLNPIGKTQPTSYTNTFSLTELTDIGVRVFLVSSNDPISLQPIISQSYTELGDSPSGYVFQPGNPFYVALYTGYQFAPPYPPEPPYQYLDPVFGWAELENVGGAIQLLNSALEYGGGGIYAGTQNIIPVPEPSELALAALAAVLFGYRRWKK